MTESGDFLSFAIVAAILILLFAGCGFVIKRFFFDKKYMGGTQIVGRQVYESFQNADRRDSIEHVIYMEEEEGQQDFSDRDLGSDGRAGKSDPESG
ncbi:MAG: hypothetical protein P1R58_04880 [bacterium]|nr:hypothetical protein [bacterium]